MTRLQSRPGSLKSLMAYLRPIASPAARRRIRASFRGVCDTKGPGWPGGRFSDGHRERLTDACFAEQDRIESRKGGQPDHPTVAQIQGVRDRLERDLRWSDGFTLIETLIALAIFTAGMLMILPVLVTAAGVQARTTDDILLRQFRGSVRAQIAAVGPDRLVGQQIPEDGTPVSAALLSARDATYQGWQARTMARRHPLGFFQVFAFYGRPGDVISEREAAVNDDRTGFAMEDATGIETGDWLLDSLGTTHVVRDVLEDGVVVDRVDGAPDRIWHGGGTIGLHLID